MAAVNGNICQRLRTQWVPLTRGWKTNVEGSWSIWRPLNFIEPSKEQRAPHSLLPYGVTTEPQASCSSKKHITLKWVSRVSAIEILFPWLQIKGTISKHGYFLETGLQMPPNHKSQGNLRSRINCILQCHTLHLCPGAPVDLFHNQILSPKETASWLAWRLQGHAIKNWFCK